MSLRSDLPDKYVQVNDLHIRYIEKGSGRPLICIHGLDISLCAEQYLVNIDALSEVAHVYALDMPGWGLSDYPAHGYSFPFWVETIKGFCEALNLEEVDIMGQSLGGWFAALFAYYYPERVRRVILIGNAGMNPAPQGMSGDDPLPDLERLRDTLHDEWFEFYPITKEILEEQLRRMQRPDLREQYLLIHQYVFDPDVRQEFSLRQCLPVMHQPLLVAWGDNPRGIRLLHALETFQLAPNGRLLVTFGGDHSAMGYTAREFEHAVRTFLTADEIKPVNEQDKLSYSMGA
jgi:pimeloyl-ACP methyl ester carboxylesterase